MGGGALTGSIGYDTTISHSGKQSIKIINTVCPNGSSYSFSTWNGTLDITSQKYLVPVKPNTKYRISCWIKGDSITSANSGGARIFAVEVNSSYTPTNHYNTLTGTFDWTFSKIDFTTSADCVFFRIAGSISSETGTAWFDDIRLEEVIEDTGYTGTVPTPLLSTITGVTSTDSVDQSLDPTFAAAYHYDLTNAVNEGATHRQTFTPTKNHLYSIKVKITAKGSGNWSLVIHDVSNNVIASQTIANASLANTTITEFTVPCLWTTGALHFHLYSSVADGTVVVGTADHDLETCSFIEYYAKPTENATIICNGDKISLSADSDGILGGAIVDLDKGKYLYGVGILDLSTNLSTFINNFYSGTQGTPIAGWRTCLQGWNTAVNSLFPYNNTAVAIIKVNTVLPIKNNFSVYYTKQADAAGTYLTDILVSLDNINYTTIFTDSACATDRVSKGNTQCLNGGSTVYIKFVGSRGAGGIVINNYFTIEADLDTSALPIPQIYPLSTNQFSDEVILPSVATRVYFRLNKFSNPQGVVVPHLEFTDASAVYIKAIPIRIDNSQETNPAVAIVKADTLYGQASGTGSDESGNYILNDGEYMTLSTATAVPRVTYQVGKGTTAFTNITKNVIYLSSNGSSNDSTKDPSHQMSVTHWYRIQSLTKTVNDIVRKISDIAQSLIPNSSFDIQFVIDGGGVTPTVASKGFITVPSKCVVTGWTLLGDVAGAIVVDVHSCAYSGFPTTTTIWSNKPTIAATNQQAQTLGTLAIPLNKGDVLEIAVDSVTTITRCTLSMHCERVR
jgi:hypothetical protein